MVTPSGFCITSCPNLPPLRRFHFGRGARTRACRVDTRVDAWVAALLALAAFATGCHSAPPAAIDRAMASCVPADTVILGGVDCQRLRASPVYRKLPAAATALLEPLRPATYLVLASNGRDYLAISPRPLC